MNRYVFCILCKYLTMYYLSVNVISALHQPHFCYKICAMQRQCPHLNIPNQNCAYKIK